MKRVLIYSSFVVLAGVLVGCNEIKTVTQKLGDLKAAKTPTATSEAVVATFDPGQISQLQESNYDAFIARKEGLVIVDFYADWCGPCKLLAPVLEEATKVHSGIVSIGKVNTDLAGNLAAKHGVKGIPDVRIYKNGIEVDRFVGFPGAEAVLQKIATHARGITPIAPVPKAAGTTGEVKPFSKDWMPAGMERR